MQAIDICRTEYAIRNRADGDYQDFMVDSSTLNHPRYHRPTNDHNSLGELRIHIEDCYREAYTGIHNAAGKL